MSALFPGILTWGPSKVLVAASAARSCERRASLPLGILSWGPSKVLLAASAARSCERWATLPLHHYSSPATSDPPRTQTWNLRLWGPTPYPLRQRTYVLGQAQGLCRSASFTDMRWQSNTCKAMAKPWPARLGFEPGPRARGTSTRPLGQPFLKGTGSLYHDTRACLTKRA